MEELAKVEGEIVGLLELLKTVNSDDLFDEATYEMCKRTAWKLNNRFEKHETLIAKIL